MKYIRKLCLLLGLFILLSLAACTGSKPQVQVDTKLSVDTSFNGEREMTATLPARVFKRFYGGDVDALKEVIDKYIPGSMYCTAAENSDGSVTITMRIDFASLKEYRKKITDICSGNQSETSITPVVNYEYSRSILKNGYSIEENFNSLDLFYWLDDALIAEYPALTEKSLEDVFVLGSTVFVFDGQEINLGSKDMIQVSDLESSAFDSLNITTTVSDDGLLEGEIRYIVSNGVAEKLGTRLDNMMNDLLPADAELSSSDGNTRRTYTMTFSRDTEEAYMTAMNKALGSNNTVFTASAEGDSEELSARQSFVLFFDGSYFLDFTNPKTYMTYVLKVPSKYTLEDLTSTYGFLTENSTHYSNDQCEIQAVVSSSDEVTMVMGFAVDIDAVSVKTDILSENHLERELTFKLSSDADALIGSSIQERLKQTAEGWQGEGSMSVDKEPLLSTVQYKITLSAVSPDNLTAMTQAVLGSDTGSSGTSEAVSAFNGGPQKHTNPWKVHYTVEDVLNFSGFLKGSNISNGISYSLTYPKRYTASFTENDAYEDALAEGAVISCSTFNKIMAVKSTAETLNIEGITIFIIWAVMLILIIVLVTVNIDHIIHYLNTKTLDMEGEALFRGKNLRTLTICLAAMVCFVIMTIRLIFKIY